MTEEVRGLLDHIYRSENAGRVDYNVISSAIRPQHRPKKPITTMTVTEVLNWQDSIDPFYNTEAAGAPQIMEDTLRRLVKQGVVAGEDIFNEETQDRLTVALMRQRGLDDWQAGKISTEDFGTNLAKEWASLPVMKATYRGTRFIPKGSAYYGGVGRNSGRSRYNVDAMYEVLGDPGRELISRASYQNTGTPGTVVAERAYGGSSGEWMRQFGASEPDPYRHMEPWRNVQVTGGGPDQLGLPSAMMADLAGMETPDYTTPTGPGGSPILHGGAGQAFVDEWTDSFIYRAADPRIWGQSHAFDLSFNPMEQAAKDGYRQHAEYLASARSADHYQYLVQNLQVEQLRNKRRQVNDHQMAAFLGAMTSPDTIMSLALPGGVVASAYRRGTVNALRSGVSAGALALGTEAALESGRAPLDPFSTNIESAIRVGGAGVLGGLFGAGLGAYLGKSMRKGLADDLTREIALARGVGRTTAEVSLGNGRTGRVELASGDVGAKLARGDRGVTVVGDRVIVDDGVISARFAQGNHGTPAKTPNELMEYEIGFAAAMSRKLKNPLKSAKAFMLDEMGAVRTSRTAEPVTTVRPGEPVEVRLADLKRLIDNGQPVPVGPAAGSLAEGRIKPLMFDPNAFADMAEAVELVKLGAELAEEAKSQPQFRKAMTDALAARRMNLERAQTPEARAEFTQATQEAHEAARKNLSKWRKENNKILQDAHMEAVARIMDSPYKRVHRNALSGEARDLMDLLGADGGLLRGTDGSGMTVGPSVYSRAHTWDGVVRRVWDQERALYAKYLGFEDNPEILPDVNLSDLHNIASKRRSSGKPALRIEEFRNEVTHAHISGTRSEIPEVNEMVSNIKAAYREYEEAATKTGVMTPRVTMSEKIKRAEEQLKHTQRGSAQWADLHKAIEDMKVERDSFGELPDDYFTRVWNKNAIIRNRETFKEQVIKPWMRENPWVETWEEGKDVLAAEFRRLKKAGGTKDQLNALRARIEKAPEKGKYIRVLASRDANAVEKRANQLIANILEEADPDELSIHREAYRPTFGRHRQFDIPNERLLVDGPMGNGIADFIETDYMLALKVYNDRMAPAIEMGRSFAAPKAGVSWIDGFAARLEDVRQVEMKAWQKAKGKLDGFDAHWDRMEIDYLHMRDRVTNRVFRNPDRLDNRMATALRNWSHMAFMGMSGLPVIQEIGTLAMRHGMSTVYRHAFTELDEVMKQVTKAGIQEMRAAGGILEVMNGTALARFAETGMDATTSTKMERFAKIGAHKMFLFNGVASLSTRLKEIDAGIRVHQTAGKIMKVADGTITDAEMADLNRFGISAAAARKMARQPMQNVEGHWLPNTNAWDDEGLVRTFRAAIRQGNENTILMATAADKPIIMDGTVYLRKSPTVDKYAAKLGLEQRGNFWKVQSGMGTLPFTFWNYAVAATNKIMLAGLDEPSVRALQGAAGLVALGWMVKAVRDDKWDSKSFDEKIHAAIEQSGVVGLFGQYNQFLEGSVTAATGTGGSRMDGFFRAAGAGPSVARNAVEGTLTADAERFSWALPYRNFWLWNWLVDSALDGLERSSAGIDHVTRAM